MAQWDMPGEVLQKTAASAERWSNKDASMQAVLCDIFNSGYKSVVSSTGAGAQAVGMLLSRPGTSSFLLEYNLPYARPSLVQAIGFEPASFCSKEVATALARRAYARALQLCMDDADIVDTLKLKCIGIGCTAAIVSGEPKRGRHRAFICAVLSGTLWHFELNLRKGARDRVAEDEAVSRLLIYAISRAVVEHPLDVAECSILDDKPSLDFIGLRPEPAQAATAEAEGGQDDEGDCVWWHIDRLPAPLQALLRPAFVAGTGVSGTPADVAAAAAAGAPASSFVVCLAAESQWLPGQCVVDRRCFSDLPIASRLPSRCGGGGRAGIPTPLIVIPGSFNPLHIGHERLAVAAIKFICRRTTADGGGSVEPTTLFELSATNVDKPAVSLQTLEARVAQFTTRALSAGGASADDESRTATTASAPLPTVLGGAELRPWSVVVTRAPLFLEKARLFPGAVFVIGVDTAARLVSPRYYPGGPAGMESAFREIRTLGCSFLVAGRMEGPCAGRPAAAFVSLSCMTPPLPPELADLFQALPESEFREDVSSTEIRLKMASADRGQGLALAAGAGTGAGSSAAVTIGPPVVG